MGAAEQPFLMCGCRSRARFREATFRYTVQMFSKLKDSTLSPAFYVQNLPWKIRVMPKDNPGQGRSMQRSLGFFLECNGDCECTLWSCHAVADLRLLSVRPDVEPVSRKMHHLFYYRENDCGFSHFMAWSDVLDPEKGYIKDDAITLEVHVVARRYTFKIYPVLSLQELCCRAIVARTTVYSIEQLPLPTCVKSHLKSYALTTSSTQLKYTHSQRKSNGRKLRFISTPTSPGSDNRTSCVPRNSCNIS